MNVEVYMNDERMKRWRNVICPEHGPDEEMRAIAAFEDQLGALPPHIERVRALISRIDPLSHYRAFENVEFVLNAIGALDYPGSPAVDVLSRHGQIDDARREVAKQYIACIRAWLDGKGLKEAKAENGIGAELAGKVYSALGERDDHKRWLAMSLVKTLKEYAYMPWDFISEYGDEEFVRAVYGSVLGRAPSSDDLKFRVEELRDGRSREDLFREVFDAREHRMGHLHRVAELLKREG